MSILHVESFENCGDEGLLGKTDAGNMVLMADIQAEELARRPGIVMLYFSMSLSLTLNAALVVSVGYIIKMPLKYTRIRI